MMEIPTQHTRTSTSPRFTRNQAHLDYSSSTQGDPHYRSNASLNGIGIYANTMSSTSLEHPGLSGHDQMASSVWNSTSLQQRSTPISSHSTPNILSAEYDPFAPLHQPASPFSHNLFTAHVVEGVVPLGSPALSGNTSQRSSFSSASASEILAQTGELHSYTSRLKMEEPTDCSVGSETLIMSPRHLDQGLLVTSTNSFPGSLDATYYHEQAPFEWSKVDYSSAQELPSIASLPIPKHHIKPEHQEAASMPTRDSRRSLSTVARTRQPRKMTSKEDANFQCHVKGCGKLFGRSYNYKAHMETHDATREYPFICMEKDCTKKFVRKTDLQRHHQSVHMKQRNFRCDYCSRLFARKDTLRRHMEDGCSKRFDIETVDFRPQGLANGEASSLGMPNQHQVNQSRLPSYTSPPPFSAHPARISSQISAHGSLLTNSVPYVDRHDYVSSTQNHDSVWQS